MAYSLINYVIGVLVLTLSAESIGKFKVSVTEEQPKGTFVADVSTEKLVQGMQYSFLDGNPFFNIDKNSGIITTSAVIDRERVHTEIFCLDVLAVPLDDSLSIMEWIPVEISIQDVNDNIPSWPNETESLKIPENISPGSKFPLAAAYDLDTLEYSTQNYSIISGNSDNIFSLEINHFRQAVFVDLIVIKSLDRERKGFYSLVVEASDGSNNTALKNINVEVLDVNEHGARFLRPKYKARVYENTVVGELILNVSASDQDTGNGEHILYFLDAASNYNNTFVIDSFTGAIRTSKALDYETKNNYRLEIIAQDTRPHGVAVKGFAIIQVVDINDNSPKITVHTFASDPSPMIPEDASLGDVVVFLSVDDKDSGKNGQVVCTLTGGHEDFALKHLRDNNYIIHVTRGLALERRHKYNLVVTARDRGRPALRTSVKFTVIVTDANRNTPKFEKEYYDIITPAETKEGSVLLTVSAIDNDKGRNSDIIYSIDNVMVLNGQQNRTVADQTWFGIHAKTGEVFLASAFACEYAVVFLFVRARDNGFNSRSTTVPIRVITFCSRHFPGQNVYHFYVSENQPIGTIVGEVNFPWYAHAHVSSFPRPIISLESDYFSTSQSDSVITTKRELDREIIQVHRIRSIIQFGDVKKSVQFIMHVVDENDNSPYFQNRTKELKSYIPSVRPTYHVIRIKAFDLDDGVNGDLTFSLANQSVKGVFSIEPSSGDVFLVNNLTQSRYEMIVTVADNGAKPNRASLKLTVYVQNEPVRSEQVSELLLTLDEIIIILVILSVIFLALLIAIFIWRRRRQNCGQNSQQRSRLYSVHYTPRRDLIVKVTDGQVITRTINNADVSYKAPELNRHLSVDYSHITDMLSKYDDGSCSSSSGFDEDRDSGKGESDRDQRNSNCSSVRSIQENTSDRKKQNNYQKKLSVIGKRLATSGGGESIPMTSISIALAEKKYLMPETIKSTDMQTINENSYLMLKSPTRRTREEETDSL